MVYLGIIFALAAGIFITVQGGINGMIGAKVGIFPTVIIPVIVQFVILIVTLLVHRDFIEGIIKITHEKHGFMFLGMSALLGIGIMTTMLYAIMKIGPVVAFTVVIFSQLLSSMLLEHYGWFNMPHHPITIQRLGALALMIIATRLFMK